VFVCAPNNPTGAGVARTAIPQLAEALTDRALLVVDEAYVEFVAPDGLDSSVAASVGDFDNLVVLRTLSKAWALAGVRIGALIANAGVVALLRKIMPPYPLPVPSVEAALQALSRQGEPAMRVRVTEVRQERTRMQLALAGLPCVRAVLPSQANFLTVRFRDAEAAFAGLSNAGVVVRDVRRYQGLGDALRITIGSSAENECVLQALRSVPGTCERATRCEEQPA
jgi:histidinol-phosphate aminotransferase